MLILDENTIEILNKTDCKCYKCGRNLPKKVVFSGKQVSAVRHRMIPRTVVKWLNELRPDECGVSITKVSNDTSNIMPMCEQCADRSGVKITHPDKLNREFVKEEAIEEYRKFYKECLSTIKAYNNLALSFYDEQEGKCKCCATPINREQEGLHILRRIDENEDYSVENTALLCKFCNTVLRGRNAR